jgi:hypothetical protein
MLGLLFICSRSQIIDDKMIRDDTLHNDIVASGDFNYAKRQFDYNM